MKKTLASIYIALLFALVALDTIDVVLAEQYTIYAEADSHVESSSPNSNFGSSQACDIYHYVSPSSTAYTYLRYSWETATPVVCAELHLVIYFYGDAGGATLSLYYCSDDGWDESSITWNNKPSFDTVPIATTVLQAGGSMSIYSTTWEPDISSLAIGESDKELSFVLTLQYGTAWMFSKEDVEGRGTSNYLTLDCGGEVPHGKIDEAEVASDKMRVCAELYHDGEEAIEEHDYYAVLVTVEDLKYKNTEGIGEIHPFITGVRLVMNGWCDEFPANHEPAQGDYGSSPTSIGFSGGGLSASIRGSAYRVYFDKWYNETTDEFYCQWTIKYGLLLGFATGYPWKDYVQFAIQIRVPEGYKPTVHIGVGNFWYVNKIFVYELHAIEELWTHVDPPGATPMPSPEPLNMEDEGTIDKYCGGGGYGCPMLFIWNGAEYVCEGLLPIHNPEGIDVIYEHTLVSTPQRVNGAYLSRLVEHPQTHSHIDQVKLYAMLENGMIIQLPLIYAWHSEDGNVLPQLLFSDEWKTDTLGADHNDGTSQSIDLKFAALSPNLEIIGFVFQIEGYNPEFKT